MRVIFEFITSMVSEEEECDAKFLEGIDFEVDFPTFLSDDQMIYPKAIQNELFQKMGSFIVENHPGNLTYLEANCIIEVESQAFDADEKGIYQRCFVTIEG